MKILITFPIVFCLTLSLFGQMKPRLQKPETPSSMTPEKLAPVKPFRAAVPAASPLFGQERQFSPSIAFQKPVAGQPMLKALVSEANGTPYWIEGEYPMAADKGLDANVKDYLEAVEPVLKLKNPSEELKSVKVETDALGFTHVRLQQEWKGVPVYGAEAILHQKNGAFYLFNGRFFPSPAISDLTPGISETAAGKIVLDHVAGLTTVKNLSDLEKKLVAADKQTEATLVVYFPEKKGEKAHLAWHVVATPNITSRYDYFVDAQTGEILHSHSNLCKLHPHLSSRTSPPSPLSPHSSPLRPEAPPLLPPDGPAEADANDLFGISRHIHTYSFSNVFYMIDASRSMFRPAQSSFPDDAAGVVWTLDAQNTSPENNNFQATHLTTTNNNWGGKQKAVSAHFFGGEAFKYFEDTHQRNSINGEGGTIISLINVVESDGSQMDNAFWNGAAMFYGNGNQGFSSPLCKSLDVAGHEMSHGVIQATANLEYMDESGALNESFADVFGAMMDRSDWKMGEDVVNPAFFPSGALRDLSDPHNGGNSLNDNGWQPAHYSERYTGSEDNGGVHINSGIPNKAFFLFANHASVGKDIAEKVYYRALSQYLTKSSIFIDCRNAVVQAAADLHGGANSAVANAAKAAFDAVGIGAGNGTDPTTDIGSNPGDEYVLMTDTDFSQLYVFTAAGAAAFNPLTTTAPLSRPSITDDGSALVFVAEDNTMHAITINWQNGATNETVIQNETIWRNAVISKDGSRLAAVTTDNDNQLWIYDFGRQEWQTFELFNPTSGQGQTTGDVQYADVLEWDFTGEWVMYDALNSLTTTGSDIEYWDISFVRVWNSAANDFGDGFTGKLFNGLPEDVSVGNPTFSKNSDYIIAFDYIDAFNEEYNLMGANIETGATGAIYQNNDLSWPNYSVKDNQIVFDAQTQSGTDVLAFISLGSNKISASGNPTVFIQGGRRGVWFADGERVLVDAGEVVSQNNLTAFPNPAGDWLTLDFSSEKRGEGLIEVFDLVGNRLLSEKFDVATGPNSRRLSLKNLTTGNYIVRLTAGDVAGVLKITKH